MNKFFLISGFVGILYLTGCDIVKEKIGLTRHEPDEFTVMQRAPLEIPSNLTSLPVPQPGAARPQETPAKQQAQTVILGNKTQTNNSSSKAENDLLSKTGAEKTNSNIRDLLDKEDSDNSTDNRTVIKKLLGIGSDKSSDSVVDADAEAKRIQRTRKDGSSITDGKVPTAKE